MIGLSHKYETKSFSIDRYTYALLNTIANSCITHFSMAYKHAKLSIITLLHVEALTDVLFHSTINSTQHFFTLQNKSQFNMLIQKVAWCDMVLNPSSFDVRRPQSNGVSKPFSKFESRVDQQGVVIKTIA